MIIINDESAGEEGLTGFSFKKIRIKDVSMKNAIKVTKVAAPIALSLIPIAGGAASSIGSKLLTNASGNANLIGRTVNAVQNSGEATKLTALSKTKVGSIVTSNAKSLINSQLSNVSSGGGVPVQTYENAEPVGVLTPVTKTPTATPMPIVKSGSSGGVIGKTNIAAIAVPKQVAITAPKDNTMLYIGGAVAVLGIGYLAMKK